MHLFGMTLPDFLSAIFLWFLGVSHAGTLGRPNIRVNSNLPFLLPKVRDAIFVSLTFSYAHLK